MCTLNASWLNSTSNFPTTMAAAVCNGRLYGSDLEGTPSITMRQPAPFPPSASVRHGGGSPVCGEAAGAHLCLCRQAEERKYELMGGCGQRFLQESEGESGLPDVGQMWTCWGFGPG